jgi:hypothetical protein
MSFLVSHQLANYELMKGRYTMQLTLNLLLSIPFPELSIQLRIGEV